MAGQFTFVLAESDSGRINKTDRDRIRSHCMQGKNKKPNSRRSLGAARRAARLSKANQAEARPHDDAEADAGIPMHAGPPGEDGNYPGEGGSSDGGSSEAARALQMPSRLKLDGEIVQFLHVESPMYPRELLSTAYTFEYVKTAIYPASPHIYFDDLRTHLSLHELVSQEVPFRQAVRFVVSAFTEHMQQQPFSATTYMHHRATIALLNARLSEEPEEWLVDTTLYIINCLAHIAIWFGRHDELIAHIRATRQVIRRRGGKRFLLQRPYIQYQLHCLELASALARGTCPIAAKAEDAHSNSETYSASYVEAPASVAAFVPWLPSSLTEVVDPKLGSVLADAQEAVGRINKHWTQYKLLQSSAFQPFHESIQTRLIALKDSLQDTVSECVRLGLLAFLAITMFRVPDNRAKGQLYPYLTNSLRNACGALEPSTPQLRVITFWVLTIAAMSILEPEAEEWLVRKWNDVARSLLGASLSWAGASSQLEEVLWIRRVHDEPGRQTYAKLIALGDRLAMQSGGLPQHV
ncbi:hypothetical protein GQ53DRAFT_840661 [Thozetella sp. PMI_491]|nr:hypothetical protein GQ53DRAFT_840661 [Thozetella sp. PMI_491]